MLEFWYMYAAYMIRCCVLLISYVTSHLIFSSETDLANISFFVPFTILTELVK